MEKALTVIHTHFHKRRTGVTRSIENIIPLLQQKTPTFVYGYGINEATISIKKLKHFLFSKENVVVHCHRNNEMLRMLYYRLMGAKFKLVYTRHAETEPSGLTKFLLAKSDVVVSLTNTMHKSLAIPNVKVSHGVATNKFKEANEIVKIEGVEQPNTILCAGRVREAKGQIVLLKAVLPLLQKNKDWCLVIVGKVDKEEFLQTLQGMIKDVNVEKQVYFKKETSNIIPYYQAAKLVVVPSYTEGFSLVCAEAMACAKTVIATKNVGVHSELIQHKKTGYLFEPGNVVELQSIIQILIEKKEFKEVSKNAREAILANWSAVKEAEELLKIYKG